ncbi:MAG: hypothetical protein N2319_07840 [Candidatus Kapabacteria bacterium]|nr:hypothetical protein [Candidatus Kapabacteria bacterium]
MITTFQVNSGELDDKLIDIIKSNFPNQEIVIDVYPLENIDFEIPEITNKKIINRINEIKSNKNIIFPNIDIK